MLGIGVIASASVAIFLVSSPAMGWGATGHRVIAEVAERRLCREARTEVQRLLALEGHNKLSQVATWADAIRARPDYKGPRHAVRLPLNGGAFRLERDCVDDACTIPLMQRYMQTLRDKSQSDSEKLEALKFVTHLVGDLHQPFHGASDGLRKMIVGGRTMRIHTYWDSGMFKVAGLQRRALASMIENRVSELAQKTVQLHPARWVEESRDIARDRILAKLGPRDVLQPADSPAQLREYVDIAVTRMAQASLRLTGILDTVTGCQSRR